ncbi:MAG: hypothetical protein JEZ06_03475 [Anaerolineaceae bacterium]|nr:hypothetical protein [Anaerolineaceae bacterium]
MSQTFYCPNCGAPLDPPSGNELSTRCPFCSTSVIVPEELRERSPGKDTLSRTQDISLLPDSTKEMTEIIRLVRAGKKEEAILRFRQTFDSSRTKAVATIEAIGNKEIVQLNLPQTFSHVQISSPEITRAKSRKGVKTGSTCIGIALFLVTLGISGLVVFLLLTKSGTPIYQWWQEIKPTNKSALILSFGEEGIQQGQLSDPRKITVDSSGNIYVADFTTGRIQKFDPSGNFMHLWDAGDGKVVIYAIEIDQSGILYVALIDSILRYDTKSGNPLEPLPNPDEYRFNDFKILSDDGIGAVVDGEDLVRLKQDGSLIWIVEDAISSVADETDTRGLLVVDGNNNFYLSGTFVESIFKYSPDGKFLNRWGSEGDGEGQFDFIYAITINDQGHLVISDQGELEIFDIEGRFIEQIDIPGIAFDIQFDMQGNLYMVTNQDQVNVYNFK